jgi:oxygen-independent coproporphyrinogen-3 oxidase
MIANSLYIHIPFCNHRCGYCDFNTFTGIQHLIPIYSQAVCTEIEYLSQYAMEQLTIKSIYFGGGTPSLVPEIYLEKILSCIENNFNLLPSPEITIEANPGTISKNYLKNIHSLGVNRISIGMQSANSKELTLLERLHSYDDVVRAVVWSRATGIKNLNLDLIFGLPHQVLESWLTTLEAALSLQPEHLSLYALTLEHGTPMQHKVETGLLPEPDPDLVADMYEAASERLAEAGFVQYEISNWARMNNSGELYSCQHNLQYWRNLPYLGLGAGAHGFINHYRTVDVSSPEAYIKSMKNRRQQIKERNLFPSTPGTIELNPIDADTEIAETMMMGLRLVVEGVSNQEFEQRFRTSLQMRFGVQIDRLISFGLLEWAGAQGERLRLTQKGYLLGNQVFTEFV